MRLIRKVFILLSLFCLQALAQSDERPPIEAFASLPAIQGTKLSPSGTRIASILNKGADSFLVVRDVSSPDIKVLAKTDNHKLEIRWFHWANDERILVSLRAAGYRYNVETVETRLLSFNYDGSGVVNLVNIDPNIDSFGFGNVAQFQDHVIDWLPEDPDHILLTLDIDTPLAPAVYKVNVNTGAREQVYHGRDHVLEWITDRQHNVRIGVRSQGTAREVLFCEKGATQCKTVWKYELNGADTINPLGFGADPSLLYVSAYKDRYLALFTVDLRDPALPLTLKYANPEHDINAELIFSERAGDVVGISDNGQYIFWDENLKNLAAGLEKTFPESSNYLISLNRDDTRYIVYTVSSSKPGIYYFGDRSLKRAFSLGETYPDIKESSLAEKKAIRFKARDDLDIDGFLTLPKNSEPKSLPTVIIPHGGDLVAQNTEFDYWSQFFANRGYAVLQIDYRGTSGHGLDFATAGLKQWGLKMQEDVADGTNWLINRGIADKNRICIVGAGFGGYSALMGVVRNSDLYRCAVSFAGISDLRYFVAHARHFTNAKEVRQAMGDSWSDADQLRNTSPRQLVNQIQVPVLLAHGSHDRIIPVEQSRDMAAALKKAGKSYRYIEFADGDHQLGIFEHRISLFSEMEKFLSENLKKNDDAQVSGGIPSP